MSNGSFALYWTSATTSYLGDGIRFAALPLLAATLSSSPGEVAAVAVAGGLPWLLFGLVAGVVVDRVDRLRLMAATQALRAGVGVALVACVALDDMSIALLAGLVFLLYTCEVVYDVAFNAALPAVVDRSRLQWANGRLITAEVVTFEFAGPALGGLLFVLSPALPFAIDGATFVVSAILLLLVTRRVDAPPTAAEPASSVRADLVAGLRWFWNGRVVRALTGLAVAVNLAAGGFYAVLVLYVGGEFGLGPAGYGLLLAIGASGSVIGGAVAGRWTSGPQRRLIILATVPVVAACFAAIAAAAGIVAVAAAMVVFGFVVTVANVVMVSLRQLVTPDEVLGRVMAAHRFFCWGSLPVGAAVAGVVGELAGLRASVVACGLMVVAVGIPAGAPLLRLTVSEFSPPTATTASG